MISASILLPLAQSAPPADDIYDIVVLAPKESFLTYLLWSLLVALFLAAIAVALYFLLRKGGNTNEKSAEARAYGRLKQTQKEKDSISTNEYTLALSETLKDYLSEKFQDPVRFETTPEFLNRVAKEPSRFPITAQQHLQSFLVRAEEVKFGNASDAEKQAAPLGKIAEQVIHLCQVVNDRESQPVK